ncbi:MAG: AMP-binding protein [Planctomycetota bacterium]
MAWQSRCLAAGLAYSGLQPGTRVALLSPNRPEWLVACFGLIQAGAVPVLIDAQIGREVLAHVLDDSGASWVFSVSDRLDSLPRQNGGHELQTVLLDATDDHPDSWRRFLANEPRQPHDMAADDTAVLFYTSGTSGAAKGVPLSHRNLACNIQAIIELDVLKPTDRILLPLPLHHVYPFTVGMLVPLASGVPVILPWSLSGPQIVRAMSEAHVTFVLGVPRIYAGLVSAIQDRVAHRGRLAALLFRATLAVSTILRKRTGVRIGRRLFSRLHRQLAPNLSTVISGGAPIDPELARTLEGLGWRFANGYGLTETSPVLSFNEPDRARIGTVGRPLPGVELRIAEPEGGRTHGEILARGANVFSGYWNLPEKTL